MTLWVIFGLAVIVGIWSSVHKDNVRNAAKERYLASLERLKERPGDPTQRQSTLELGRAYSSLMRDKKGQTLFDEVALMNDINAACAAVHLSTPPLKVQSNSPSVEDRLKRLQQLREQGLIEESDYTQRKREIIGQI